MTFHVFSGVNESVGNHWREMKKPFVFQNNSFQVAQQAEIGIGKDSGIDFTDTHMHRHPQTHMLYLITTFSEV